MNGRKNEGENGEGSANLPALCTVGSRSLSTLSNNQWNNILGRRWLPPAVTPGPAHPPAEWPSPWCGVCGIRSDRGLTPPQGDLQAGSEVRLPSEPVPLPTAQPWCPRWALHPRPPCRLLCPLLAARAAQGSPDPPAPWLLRPAHTPARALCLQLALGPGPEGPADPKCPSCQPWAWASRDQLWAGGRAARAPGSFHGHGVGAASCRCGKSR